MSENGGRLSADKYSGIVAVIAILAMIIYSEGTYDHWDMYLGALGFILGIIYVKDIKKKDYFLMALSSSLISLSVTCCIFYVIGNSDNLEFLQEYAFFEESIWLFLILHISSFGVICFNKS